MWLILALATAVFWAIGSVLVKRSTNHLPKSIIYFLNAAFFLVGWLIYWFLTRGFAWDWQSFLIAALPGLGYLYVLMAFSRAEVSLVTSIGSIHPVVTALLAVSFLGERLSWLQLALIAAVAFGAVVMSLPEKIRQEQSAAWVKWGLGFGLISGVVNFTIKIGINRIDVVSFSLMTAAWQALFALIYLILSQQGQTLRRILNQEGKIALLGTSLFNFGSMTVLLAIGLGKVSLVMAVANMYVALLLILAAWWLNERLTARQMAGVGVVVGSVVWLSLVSS